MIKNKKAQALSINTVILTILAIFVLVILVIALTGGFGNFVEWWQGVFGMSGMSLRKAIITCESYCVNYELSGIESLSEKYCTEEMAIDFDNDGETDETVNCRGLENQGDYLSCPGIRC